MTNVPVAVLPSGLKVLGKPDKEGVVVPVVYPHRTGAERKAAMIDGAAVYHSPVSRRFLVSLPLDA